MKVIVLGAGIGGLTAAHELAKRNIQVVVYERNDRVGGLARSAYYIKDNKKYPVEYSWRVYGTGYKNLQRVLQEIPLRENQRNSTFNNLLRVATYIFPHFDRPEVVLSPERKTKGSDWGLTRKEKRQMLEKMLFCAAMSRQRMDSMDGLRWKDFCADLSGEAKKYLVRMWGPVLGMDPSHMSFPVVARIVGVVFGGFLSAAGALYLMKKPTNDGWFDEWVAHLESRGVNIHTRHELRGLDISEGRISGVRVFDVAQGTEVKDQADYYVLGLSVEALAKIVQAQPDLKQIPELQNSIPLAQVSKQVQLSVQIFLDQEVNYHTQEPPILYLPDSPWAIIIEPQELVWGKTFSDDPRVKSVWSVGICQTDEPGILTNKSFNECSPEEIRQEVWAQIKRSYAQANITTVSGEKVSEKNEVLFYMWDSFKYNPATKQIEIWEPKFSNNAATLQYQPSNVTSVPNLLFATGYTKTDRFIYSMESAAEAGTACANHILSLTGSQDQTPVFPFKLPVSFLRPLCWLDRVLFRVGMPYLGTVLPNTFWLLGAYGLVWLAALGFLAWLASELLGSR